MHQTGSVKELLYYLLYRFGFGRSSPGQCPGLVPSGGQAINLLDAFRRLQALVEFVMVCCFRLSHSRFGLRFPGSVGFVVVSALRLDPFLERFLFLLYDSLHFFVPPPDLFVHEIPARFCHTEHGVGVGTDLVG